MATNKRDQFRSQFEATPIGELKKVVKKDDSSIPSSKGGRADFLSIDDGLNKYRLFPKHKGEKNFYHMRGIHWMTIENEAGEEVRRTIPNAKIHAGWAKDIIDEYIDYVKKNLDADDSDDADKLKKIVSWQDGIVMQTSWVAYANKMAKGKPSEFGVLEFKKTVRDAMNNESIIEDEDESISIDPYTDIDDGKPILITYNSKAKKAADYYKVQLSKTAVPLTDAELEAFAKATPLSQLQMFKYDSAIFEQALNGLQLFDASMEIDLFDSDEFQEIIEEVRTQFEGKSELEDEEEDEEPAVTKKSTAKKSTAKKPVVEEEEEEEENDEGEEEYEEVEEEEEETEEGDEFDEMDRSALKAHLKKNGIEFKVTTKTTDDEIRDAIRSAAEVLVEDEDEEEEEEEDDEPEVTKKTTTKAGSKDKPKTLEEIKAELRKKQGK